MSDSPETVVFLLPVVGISVFCKVSWPFVVFPVFPINSIPSALEAGMAVIHEGAI